MTEGAATATDIGDRVVALRSEGKSFDVIARTVGMARSLDAFGLFVDTVAGRPETERAKLCDQENRRLDALEERTTALAESTERTRKLGSLEKLRLRLAAIR